MANTKQRAQASTPMAQEMGHSWWEEAAGGSIHWGNFSLIPRWLFPGQRDLHSFPNFCSLQLKLCMFLLPVPKALERGQ